MSASGVLVKRMVRAMTSDRSSDGKPDWAVRLQREREGRGWGQREMARVLLRTAEWEVTTKAVDSVSRQIRGWENAEHFPRDWTAHYAAAFDLDEAVLFEGAGLQMPRPRPRVTDRSASMPAGPGIPAQSREGPRSSAHDPGSEAAVTAMSGEAIDLATWAEQTNIGDTTIDFLFDSVRRLSEEYLRRPPGPVLSDAAALYRRTADILRGGHQQLRQTRDLHVIAGQLLAFLSWASSDLGQPGAAEAYAAAGWVMADQADDDAARALVLIARGKNAFWEKRLARAVEYAKRGLAVAPATSARVLLACQLGGAHQALGDVRSALAAHDAAVDAREAMAGEELGGLWWCGPARQANYAMWVHLRAGDSMAALEAAGAAQDAYADGDHWAYGTWAQVMIGTAIAQLQKGEPEGAAETLDPILQMPAEQRLATLSERLGDVDRYLGHRKYAGDPHALSLREQIGEYRADTVTVRALTTGES